MKRWSYALKLLKYGSVKMSHYINLEINHTTFSELCDVVETAAKHAEDFDEIQDLVHLLDFLEEEYDRDLDKQNSDLKAWWIHEELFRDKKLYHQKYFYRLRAYLMITLKKNY